MYARDYEKTPATVRAFEDAMARQTQLRQAVSVIENTPPADPPASESSPPRENRLMPVLLLYLLLRDLPKTDALALLLLLGL